MPNFRGLHSLKTFRIAVKAAREAYCAHDTWLPACFQGPKSVKARGLNPVKTSRTNNKLSSRFGKVCREQRVQTEQTAFQARFSRKRCEIALSALKCKN